MNPINYGISVDPDKLYPVTYQILQDGTRVEEMTFLHGRDMTENQIKQWLHFKSSPSEIEPQPVQIGTLTKRQGLNGYNVAEIGHPVYEFKDRYIIYLESEKGLPPLSVPYYKETLRPIIQFL